MNAVPIPHRHSHEDDVARQQRDIESRSSGFAFPKVLVGRDHRSDSVGETFSTEGHEESGDALTSRGMTILGALKGMEVTLPAEVGLSSHVSPRLSLRLADLSEQRSARAWPHSENTAPVSLTASNYRAALLAPPSFSKPSGQAKPASGTFIYGNHLITEPQKAKVPPPPLSQRTNIYVAPYKRGNLVPKPESQPPPQDGFQSSLQRPSGASSVLNTPTPYGKAEQASRARPAADGGRLGSYGNRPVAPARKSKVASFPYSHVLLPEVQFGGFPTTPSRIVLKEDIEAAGNIANDQYVSLSRLRVQGYVLTPLSPATLEHR